MMSLPDLHKFEDVIFGITQNCFTLHYQTWSDDI